MKKCIIFNKLVTVLFCFFLSITFGNAQESDFSIALRIPIQVAFQRAAFKDTRFPFEFKEQTTTEMNWGIDFLSEKQIFNRWGVYFGIGYFRNKFNFKRAYDHQLLNIGRDSIPIGTSTHSYIYNFLRFPIGIIYQIKRTQKNVYKIGGEIIFNYSFQKIYNGGKPFPDANNKISAFQYSGNSIIFFASIGIPNNSYSLLQLEPYLRIYHTYKKDRILYEDPKESIKNSFDAIGLTIKYYFKKRIK